MTSHASAKKIYLDYAAATPLDPAVITTMARAMVVMTGNPSSLHASGRSARRMLDDARERISAGIGAGSDEIIFTGSGTESDNLAIFGIARAYKHLGRHIIVSAIEHLAIIRACQYLEQHEGFAVTYLPVQTNGIVNIDALKAALRPDTILISIMCANNEIGTIQPILKISKMLKEYKKQKTVVSGGESRKLPIFHTDASQAIGALSVNVQQLGIDLLTFNGSKIYGPKGTGVLYVKRGLRLVPLTIGGSQEHGRRAGTENPALYAGLAKALQIATRLREKESKRLTSLRDYMIKRIVNTISDVRLNGDPILRLPNNINISFDGVDGEMLMVALDQQGIEVSTGSACTTISTEPSHVIRAIDSSPNSGKGNIRITLGRQTTKKDLDHVIEVLIKLVVKLRKLNG